MMHDGGRDSRQRALKRAAADISKWVNNSTTLGCLFCRRVRHRSSEPCPGVALSALTCKSTQPCARGRAADSLQLVSVTCGKGLLSLRARARALE